MARDVEQVFQSAGLGHLAADAVRLLTTASARELREISVPVGRQLEWMTQRVKGTPEIMRVVEWRGSAAFAAFEFALDDGMRGYTFIVPRACANLSLASVGPSPRAEAPRAADETRRATRPESRQRRARRKRHARPRPRPSPKRHGSPSRRERWTTHDAQTRRGVQTSRDARKTSGRRKRHARPPMPPSATGARESTCSWRCSWQGTAAARRDAHKRQPLPGAWSLRAARGRQVGTDVRLGQTGWRLAPSIGVAVNTRDSENTSLFGEAELNYWLGDTGFVGTGIGAWDLTHSDTLAGSWLVHAG